MYGTSYIFSKPFFRFWVAITFLWGFGAALTITLLPLFEGRKTLSMFWLFITGKQEKMAQRTEGVHPPREDVSRDDGVASSEKTAVDTGKDAEV